MLDTHALVWWVSDGSKLSGRAKQVVRSALRSGPVSASAISLFEIATAVRRGRLTLAPPLERWLADLRALPELRFEPVSADIAAAAGQLPDPMPGDPADRIIAATAVALQAKLVTADERLRKSPYLRVVW